MTLQVDNASPPPMPYAGGSDLPPGADRAGGSGASTITPGGSLGATGTAAGSTDIGAQRAANGAGQSQQSADLALERPRLGVEEMGPAAAATALMRLAEDFVKQFGLTLGDLNDKTVSSMREYTASAAKKAMEATQRMERYLSSPLRKLNKWLAKAVGVVIAVVVAAIAISAAAATGGAALVVVAALLTMAAGSSLGLFLAMVTYDAQGMDGLPDWCEHGGGAALMGVLTLDMSEMVCGFAEMAGFDRSSPGVIAVAVVLTAVTSYLSFKGAAKAAESTAKGAEQIGDVASMIAKSQIVDGMKDGLSGIGSGIEIWDAGINNATVQRIEAESMSLANISEMFNQVFKEGGEVVSALFKYMAELVEAISKLLTNYTDGFKATASTPQPA